MENGHYNILVIDDDAVDRRVVKRALASAGTQVAVEEAANGEDGVQMARDREFDAILLDYHLPDGDGLGVLTRLKSLKNMPPIIALTGQGSEEVAVQFMKSGAADYLAKDHVSPHRLAATVRNVINRARLSADIDRLEVALFANERSAVAGAVARTTLDGYESGIAGVADQLGSIWKYIGEQGDAPLDVKEAQDEVEAMLAEMKDLRDASSVLVRLLAAEASFETHALDEILKESLDVHTAFLPSGIRLDRRLEASESAPLDPGAVRHILARLVQNAVAALPDGGTIRVESGVTKDSVTLAVEDSGPGVAPGLGMRVYDLHVTDHEGREGLGLTLVKHLARAHGGTVTHDRSMLGGARFTVRFPRAGQNA